MGRLRLGTKVLILPDGHYCDECRAMAGLVGEIVEVIEQGPGEGYDYIVETKKGRTCVMIDGEDAEVFNFGWPR